MAKDPALDAIVGDLYNQNKPYKEIATYVKTSGGNPDEYIMPDPGGLTIDQESKVQELKDFENSKLGKFLGITDKVIKTPLSFVGISQDMRPLSQRYAEEKAKANQETTGENITRKIGEIASDTIKHGAQLVPLLLGGLGVGVGKTVLGRVATGAAVQGAVSGASKRLEVAAEGGTPKEAIDAGMKTGVTNAVLTPVMNQLAPSIIKKIADFSIVNSSGVDKMAVENAIGNPGLLLREDIPSVVEMGDKFKNKIQDLKTKFGDNYFFETTAAIGEHPLGTEAVVNTTPLIQVFKNKNISEADLINKLEIAASKALTPVERNMLERAFLPGKDQVPITVGEAVKINRLLFDALSGAPTGVFDATGIQKIKAVKSALLTATDKIVPGLKAANKRFAEAADKLENINSNIFDKDGFIKEANVPKLVKLASGKVTDKRQVGGLINELGLQPEIQELKDAYTKEAFDLGEGTKAFRYFNYASMGMGGAVGSTIGGPVGGGVGAVLGAAASMGVSKPEVTKALIRSKGAVEKASTGLTRRIIRKKAGDYAGGNEEN